MRLKNVGRLKEAQALNDPFTLNKQKIRELNLCLIERHFHSHKGELRYLGLPAASMRDILLWKDYLAKLPNDCRNG